MGRNLRKILVLHTNKMVIESKSASIESISVEVLDNGGYKIISYPVDVYPLYIGFGNDIGTAYSCIMSTRKKLNIVDNLYESSLERKLDMRHEYREITRKEEIALRNESAFFEELRKQQTYTFLTNVAQELERQVGLVEQEFHRRVMESYRQMDCTILTFINNPNTKQYTLSTNWNDVFTDVQNFVEPMIQDDRYWGIRFSSITWSTDIMTVKFRPFNVLFDAKNYRGEYMEKDSRTYLESFYTREGKIPRGPRINLYTPKYFLKYVHQGGKDRWMHWMWTVYEDQGLKGYS